VREIAQSWKELLLNLKRRPVHVEWEGGADAASAIIAAA